VREATGDPGLAGGALEQGLALGAAEVGGEPQLLDRDLAVDDQVDGAPHGADTAPGDLRHQLVAPLEQASLRTGVAHTGYLRAC